MSLRLISWRTSRLKSLRSCRRKYLNQLLNSSASQKRLSQYLIRLSNLTINMTRNWRLSKRLLKNLQKKWHILLKKVRIRQRKLRKWMLWSIFSKIIIPIRSRKRLRWFSSCSCRSNRCRIELRLRTKRWKSYTRDSLNRLRTRNKFMTNLKLHHLHRFHILNKK